MGDLKSALKESNKLLAGGKSREVLDLLQPFLDRETDDYMLFSFAALANANLEYFEDAQELYEKGIKMDEAKPQAWMGLFKLYDQEDVELDKRGLDICERIMAIGDGDKQVAATALRRKIQLKFGQYDDLYGDLGEDDELMTDIVDKLETKKFPTVVEKQLLEEAFLRLTPHLPSWPDYHLKYCRYLFDQGKPSREVTVAYAETADTEKTDWIMDRLIELLAEDYFVGVSVAENSLWPLIEEEKTQELMQPALAMLKELKEGKLTDALELLDQLAYSQTVAYPTCLLSCRLFVEIENWEQLVKVLNAFPKRAYWSEEVTQTRQWLLVKGYLESDGSVPDNVLVDSCYSAPTVPVEFIRERIRLAGAAGKTTSDGWKGQLGEEDRNKVGFLEQFYAEKWAEAVEEGAKILETTWQDLLNLAEAKFALGQDCVSLLVKAAKLAPRSSRVFYMLGRALLQKKNPDKARGCLERAVKVRPLNVDYIRALDDVLAAKETTKPEDRLAYLKPLTQQSGGRRAPKWIRERIASLSLAAGDLDTATAEFQRLLRESPQDTGIWAKLAEVYSRRGHLNSAVSAYEQILELQPKSDHYISLVGLLIRLRRDDDALEKCAEWRECGSPTAEAAMYMDLLETLANLRLAETTFGEEKMQHIRTAVRLLSPVLVKQPQFSLPHKLAGDVLLLVSRYHPKYLDGFELDASWQVTSENILEKAVDLYATALHLCRENILAWSDLAVVLLLTAQKNRDPEAARQAEEILKKAIQLTDFDATKSALWNLLGEARRLSRQSAASQQHCYVRALQLNKANDEAWLRLAILYMENGEVDAAHQAFETALKYNPHSAEAWCGWAAKAESEGVMREASDMYRQALIIKSLPMAVNKFTAIVCEQQRANRTSFDTSSVLRDFPEIFDVYYSSHSRSNATLLTHLGVLAELFGHYKEAIDCHRDAGSAEHDANLQRAMLKEGTSLDGGDALNPEWVKMTREPAERLLEVVKENQIYGKLFGSLKEDDEDSSGLKEVFLKHRKQISMPLVISAIILFEMPISDSAVQVLHDVLPRHELVDVFPTILPAGLDTELQYLEQDGEALFRYRHEIARRLYEELLQSREELEEEEEEGEDEGYGEMDAV